MKREQKYNDTRYFHYRNVNPKNRITGDCVFRAFTLAMNQCYNETVMEMAELMCKTGFAMNDKKGEEKYLKEKGWVKMPQPRKYDGTKYTGKEFCRVIQNWIWDEDRIGNEWGDGIVISPSIIAGIGSHHVVAIMDGVINDIWDCSERTIGNYWIKAEVLKGRKNGKN